MQSSDSVEIQVRGGPCAKQTVQAVLVSPSGAVVKATNACRHPQEACPRGDLPSGVGYEKCKEVCGQWAHAEVAALELAEKRGIPTEGAVVVVTGHTMICEDCARRIAEAGAVGIVALHE